MIKNMDKVLIVGLTVDYTLVAGPMENKMAKESTYWLMARVKWAFGNRAPESNGLKMMIKLEIHNNEDLKNRFNDRYEIIVSQKPK